MHKAPIGVVNGTIALSTDKPTLKYIVPLAIGRLLVLHAYGPRTLV